VRRVALEHGLLESPPQRIGEREETRQRDLKLLVGLAEDGWTVAQFVEDLRVRFSSGAAGGVHLLTYHRAKGLEFDAVFLPRLEEKELPSRQAKTPEQLAEERRLLYVGLTRARRHLVLSWNAGARPSRFLAELGLGTGARPARDAGTRPPDTPAHAALRKWRLERARADGVPAYVVMHDATLAVLVERRPASRAELAGVPGIGPAKLDRYGDDLLAALAAAPAA
jgi:DNA helicase II / ATP-dependent DNA helicase PcrA